jgi:hypothetical protein
MNRGSPRDARADFELKTTEPILKRSIGLNRHEKEIGFFWML